MSELLRYCQHCGAANAPESLLCFSCQHPFAEQDEAIQGVVLLGRYQFLTQVGAGGFGGVYRALDLAEGRQVVAVKEINLRGLSAQEMIEATDGFNREVSLLSSLHHASLPRIRNTFTDAEHWYVVMDFIEGETLEAYLAERTVPARAVLEIILQICDVLDYLHTREPAIIFRDLKPGNVMRTPAGRIYLIDFGIARLFSPGKLKDTMPFGSPGYAAPEQYGRMQTTPQADIYSLGALLHYLLTGHDPAETPFRFASLPDTADPALAELDTLIQRMVALEPAERPASVSEVREIVQRLFDDMQRQGQQGEPVWVPPASPLPAWDWTPPAPPPAPLALPRRKVLTRALAIGGTVVGVGGIVSLCGGALFLTRYHPISGSVALPPPSPGGAKQAFVYRRHRGAITALSWSPDGSMVASGSADGTVQVWRSADGALFYTLSGYTDAVTSVVWASDRQNVIASAGNDDGTVQVWDALRDHRDLIWHGDGRVLALAWQEKSPWMASGGTDRDIYIWNATTGARGISYRGHKGNVNALLWLSSGSSASPAGTPTAPSASSTQPPPTPTPTSSLPSPYLVASGGADGTVQIWSAQSGRKYRAYVSSHGAVNGLALVQDRFTPDQYLAAACDDGSVLRWSLEANATLLPEIYRGHRRKVNAITALYRSVETNGLSFASAGDDQKVYVWASSRLTPLFAYTGHNAPVRAVAASPVDSRVVSGDSAGLVHLWTAIPPGYR